MKCEGRAARVIIAPSVGLLINREESVDEWLMSQKKKQKEQRVDERKRVR